MSVMKTMCVATLAAGLAATATAQTRSVPEAENNRIVTAEAPAGAARTNTNAAQIEFLVEALRSSLGEIRMGELATEQSYDQRVRDYGAPRTRHVTRVRARRSRHASCISAR